MTEPTPEQLAQIMEGVLDARANDAPWMPIARVMFDLTNNAQRYVSHEVDKQIAALPGDGVFALNTSRRGAYMTQHIQVEPDGNLAVQLMPYEPMPMWAMLEDLPKVDGLADLQPPHATDGSRSYALSLSLHKLAWSRRTDFVLPGPEIGAPTPAGMRHNINVRALANGDSIVFTHNWDDWAHEWTTPLSYVENSTNSIWYRHATPPHRSIDIVQESTFRLFQARTGSRYSGFGSAYGHEVSGVTVTHRINPSLIPQQLLFQAVVHLELQLTEGGPTRVVAGWLYAHLEMHRARVFDVFVHPELRRSGLSRLLALESFEKFLAFGINEIVFRLDEADLTAMTDARKPPRWPRWLHQLPWVNVSQPSSSVARQAAIDRQTTEQIISLIKSS